MIHKAALLLVLVLTAAGLAQSDPVVATVGKSSITKSEFDLQFNLFVRDALQKQGMPYTPEAETAFAQYKPDFLKRMARETAITKASEAAGLAAKDEAVEAALQDIQGQFETPEALNAALAEAGIPDLGTYKRLVYEALTYNTYLESLGGKFQVSEPAIGVIYTLSKRELTTPQRYCSAHILVKTAKEAQEIIARLGKGEGFGDIARATSIDPGSKDQGGDLGCEPRGTFVAPFEAALVALKPGESSKKPVKTEFGYHVILLVKIEPAGVQPLEAVKGDLVKSVQSRATQKYLDRVAEHAQIRLFPENLGTPAQ